MGCIISFFECARKQLLGQLRIKCRNLMGKDKVMELIEKFIDLGRIGKLIKGIAMMIARRRARLGLAKGRGLVLQRLVTSSSTVVRPSNGEVGSRVALRFWGGRMAAKFHPSTPISSHKSPKVLGSLRNPGIHQQKMVR
jgi:hypothetical protein